MNQHSFQKAYYDLFCDAGGMIWVYPKEGGKSFRKPTSWCTAETDFQSASLEKAQANFIESPGIKALRNLTEGKQSESEYNFTLQWIALHLIRNQKMRDMVMKDGEDYERQFPEEFEKEVLYLKSRYTAAYSFKTSNFFITSDNPIMEICCSEQRLLFFAFSPQIFFSFLRDRAYSRTERKALKIL
jgi:hypothetical protein